MCPIPAARYTDPIEHTEAMAGFLMGALAGAAIALTAVAIVGTGGAALGVIAAVGGVVAATGGGALIGEAIGRMFTSVSGAIAATCSTNVFMNDLGAARAELDRADCEKHPGTPGKQIATGAATVLINGYPAARKDEALVCGGWISGGSENVLIGGPSVQLLDISPEVPEWMTTAATWMMIGGTVVALGAGFALAVMGGWCGVGMFAAGIGAGFVGGYLGSGIGGIIGQAIDGERGQAIGEMVGGFLGGFFGGALGARSRRGHPVDVATGELFTTTTDFSLPGPLPFSFTRYWMSSSHEKGQSGDFGAKWHHEFDLRLHLWNDMRGVVVRQADGHLTVFPLPKPGQPVINTIDRLTLRVGDAPGGRGYVMSTYEGISFVFAPDPRDPQGFLLARIQDPNGNAIRLSRDDNGHLSGITDSAGRDLVVSTNAQGWITAIHGPATQGEGHVRLVSYEYSREGDLTSATDARGNSWRYDYAAHLLRRETYRGGLVYHFRWDDLKAGTAARCIETWGESEIAQISNLHYTRFDYAEDANSTAVTDANGAAMLYHHTGTGKVVGITDSAGVETVISYDLSGHETLMRDSLGRSQANQYDGFGRLVRTKARSGAGLSQSYASDDPMSPLFGMIARTVIGEGADAASHEMTYDSRGNLVAHTDPVGQTERTLRDARGLPVAKVDDLGARWRWQWDSDGMLAAEGPDQLVRHYTHDVLGRLDSQREGTSPPTRLRHDLNGNVVAISFADGRGVAMEYDADDNLIMHRDPSGNVTRQEFGGLREPIARLAADGGQVRFRYDHEMRVIAVANAKGEVMQNTYNALGQLVAERGFDQLEKRYEYDECGFPSAVEYGGKVIRLEFDRVGNLLSRQSGGSRSEFEWSSRGFLRASIANGIRTDYLHDANMRLVAEKRGDALTEHVYDCRGNRVRSVLPDRETIERDYTSTGQLSRVTLQGREIAAWRYQQSGDVIERAQVGSRLTYALDDLGRPTANVLFRDEAPFSAVSNHRNRLISREYHWNDNDTVRAVNDSRTGARHYSYDEADRLIAVDGAMPERFQYDPANNLVRVARNLDRATGPSQSPMSPEPEGFTGTATGDRLQVHGDERLDYDARGNVIAVTTSESRLTLFYDDSDLLVRSLRETATSAVETQYAYDAFSRRILKSSVQSRIEADGSRTEESRDATAYLWDEDLLIAEGPADGDHLARLYFYDTDGLTPFAFADRAEDGSRRMFYCNTDLVGTPQEIVDEAGNIVWAAIYTAYGAALADIGDGFHQPLRFPGQYHDPETGLHYNRYRYYMPQFGRYTQPDPIGVLGGMNAYFYPTNPLLICDPLGLNWFFDQPEKGLGVIYDDPNTATNIQQGVRTTGVNRAWAQEAELVRSYDRMAIKQGGVAPKYGIGTRRWTPAQKAELLKTGKVRGFTPHHINSVADHPHLKGDPRNLRILPGTKTNPLGNQHLYADKGHSGNYRNQTTGQLIDRQAMINRNNQIADGCP